MNWEAATFGATLVIQLLVAGIAWGKIQGRVQANEDGLKEVKVEQILHGGRITSLESRISVAEAYQQGLKDGTSHMRAGSH